MKNRSGLKSWLLYALIRLAAGVVEMFPMDVNLRTARWMASIWPRITKKYHDRAFKHLRASFSAEEYCDEELRRIVHRATEHLVMFAMEVICAPRLVRRSTLNQFFTFKNISETLEVLLEGKGAILLTGHYGHFELPGYLLACLGFDVSAVMRPFDNVYLNDYIVRKRREHGLRLIDKSGAAMSARTELVNGGIVGFIADQDAGRKGVFVDFFGRPASTYKSIGILAMHAQVPIIVGYARRKGDRFAYEIGVNRIIRPEDWEDKDDRLRWITQEYTSAIEQFIREDPAQYLWIHRRWKSQPRVPSADRGSVESRQAAPQVRT